MINHKYSKRYNDDFRKLIVGLYNSGQKVKDLSSGCRVSEVTIYSWIKKFTPLEPKYDSSIPLDDYDKLQKQIHELQAENDILKKAMIIFFKNKWQ